MPMRCSVGAHWRALPLRYMEHRSLSLDIVVVGGLAVPAHDANRLIWRVVVPALLVRYRMLCSRIALPGCLEAPPRFGWGLF